MVTRLSDSSRLVATPGSRSLVAGLSLSVALAFLAVYVIWGSTYLAIRVAVESMPPFLMAGARWILAGGALYAWLRLRGAPKPERVHWRSAAIIGALLLLGGNGLVSWAEQLVPSGITALMIGTVPVWFAIIAALAPGGERPTVPVVIGIVLGLAGVAVLVGPSLVDGVGEVHVGGGVAILFACVFWASGSLYSRRAKLPSSTLLGAAMEMLAGGVILVIVGLVAGEAPRVDLPAVSARSWIAWLFLVTFGSIVAYASYVWLLKVQPPSRVATYAFVNPIVAVVLGWLVLDEVVTARTLAAAALIVASVAITVLASARAKGAARPPPKPDARDA